jgi:hypothetical protein
MVGSLINREANMNKMNNKMLAALKQDTDNKLPKELEIATTAHKKELKEIKERYKITIRTLEHKVKDLEIENQSLKSKGEQTERKEELKEREWKVKLEEEIRKRKELEWKVTKAEDTNKKLMLTINKEMEKVKSEYNRKLDEMKVKCEQSILKFKEEKVLLEEQLKKEGTQELCSDTVAQTSRERIHNVKKLKQELFKAKELLEESEVRMGEMKEYIRKLEKNEKNLKESIREKVNELEEARSSLQEKFEQEQEKMQHNFNQERKQLMRVFKDKGCHNKLRKEETMNAPRAINPNDYSKFNKKTEQINE